MSQTHIDHCVAALHVGAPEGFVTSLADYRIPEADVLALDETFTFDDDESYCPLSDIPRDISTVGVHVRGERAYVCGDNGDCLFMFRLSKQ